MPKYPVRMEVSWKRPLFMASTVTSTIRVDKNNNKVYFELHSEDKQHLHVSGFVEHVENMTLAQS